MYLLVMSDGQYRRGTAVPVKVTADIPWTTGRDLG